MVTTSVLSEKWGVCVGIVNFLWRWQWLPERRQASEQVVCKAHSCLYELPVCLNQPAVYSFFCCFLGGMRDIGMIMQVWSLKNGHSIIHVHIIVLKVEDCVDWVHDQVQNTVIVKCCVQYCCCKVIIKHFYWLIIMNMKTRATFLQTCKAPPPSLERYQLVDFTLLQLFLQLALAERVAYLEVKNLPVASCDQSIKQWPWHVLTISLYTSVHYGLTLTQYWLTFLR